MALLAIVWLFWACSMLGVCILLGGPLEMSLVLATGLTLLQWFVAPALLQAMVRFDWSQDIGVLEDGDPYVMTFGRTARDARTVATRGLLDRPELLELALKREAAMRPGVGPATMVCVPLLLCRYLSSFFLGAGQDKAFRAGIGSGVFMGVLADVLGRTLEFFAAPFLQARHQRADARLSSSERRRLLIPLYRMLSNRTDSTDAHLKRAYAAAAAVFAPLDAREACGIAVWRHHSAHPLRDGAALARFHPPLGERIGRLVAKTPMAWPHAAWFGLAAGVAGACFLPGHFGLVPGAVGLAWLGALWRVRRVPRVAGAMMMIRPADDGDWPELVERPILVYQDTPWALRWRSALGRFDVFLPAPVWPSEAIVEVEARVRRGALPELEVVRCGRLVNRTVAVHATMAVLLLLIGAMLESITVLFG